MNPKLLQPMPYELAAEFDDDYERYLFIVQHGEPYDLDECLWCGAKQIGNCYCEKAGRCVICSAWGETLDGLCLTCSWVIAFHLPKFERELEARMADLGLV